MKHIILKISIFALLIPYVVPFILHQSSTFLGNFLQGVSHTPIKFYFTFPHPPFTSEYEFSWD
ncbi:hypothetical protein [Myroides odoratus]|uniref:hypothetical protein n=1 Tax=Myroides odoratus TaxID=256 RepID=UPI0011C030AE|nr:hypothetical protein [Myroides odoratus]QQU04959.1 hypothetical protein I6I89_06645 [Myroides odoratus]